MSTIYDELYETVSDNMSMLLDNMSMLLIIALSFDIRISISSFSYDDTSLISFFKNDTFLSISFNINAHNPEGPSIIALIAELIYVLMLVEISRICPDNTSQLV
jgi:hypothetical protein